MTQHPPEGPDAHAPHAGDDAPPLDHSRRNFIIATSTVASAVAVGVPSIVSAQSADSRLAESPRQRISLTVNGTSHALDIDARQSLLDVVRETLGLTGTKKGCNQGACGACTLIVNDRRIVSCLALAALYDGSSVTTVEGLASGDELHPLQIAFIDHEGFQCGYCTSGQIMSGVACIREGHAGSPQEIQRWMSGNICRCGAYQGITAAIADAAGRSNA